MIGSDQNRLYMDRLDSIRSTSGKDPKKAAKEVASQFESLFIQMMLKSMRSSVEALSDGGSLSSAGKQYRDMFDGQISVAMAERGGLGLSDVIERQLFSSLGVDESSSSGDPMPLGEAMEMRHLNISAEVKSKPIASKEMLYGSPESFVSSLRSYADEAAKELGVDPNVLISQAALETGWGRHVIKNPDGSSSFNFFNIKAHNGWSGETAEVSTIEYRDGVAQREIASFRSYNSPQESFEDYVNFLKDNPRYREALSNTSDPEAFVRSLHGAGYATDPEYSNKILSIYARIA